jgi:hypothetical protein
MAGFRSLAGDLQRFIGLQVYQTGRSRETPGKEYLMEPIPAELVEKSCSEFWSLSEQEAFRLSFKLEKQQPLLVAYLAAVDRDILNQAERERLFYLGTLVWQIMLDQNKNLPMISEDKLLGCEKANLKIAASLKNANTTRFAEVIKTILKDYGQPEVFRYIIAALLEEEEEEESQIRDEILGIIMLDLKTVIDCFS